MTSLPVAPAIASIDGSGTWFMPRTLKLEALKLSDTALGRVRSKSIEKIDVDLPRLMSIALKFAADVSNDIGTVSVVPSPKVMDMASISAEYVGYCGEYREITN